MTLIGGLAGVSPGWNQSSPFDGLASRFTSTIHRSMSLTTYISSLYVVFYLNLT